VVYNIAKESADPPPQTMLPAVREGTYRPNAAAAVVRTENSTRLVELMESLMIR
jgi:hypothetical protein